MAMRDETRQPPPWVDLGALMLAAGLAAWLLMEPGLLRGLALPWRLPLIGLGAWALGSAFLQGLGLTLPRGPARRLTSPPWSLAALGAFTLVLLARGLVG
jgi:hypothetical protein